MIDPLKAVAKINDDLISANALLRDENERWRKSHAELRERVSVLTEALEDISCSSCSPHEAWQIARAALTRTSEGAK